MFSFSFLCLLVQLVQLCYNNRYVRVVIGDKLGRDFGKTQLRVFAVKWIFQSHRQSIMNLFTQNQRHILFWD